LLLSRSAKFCATNCVMPISLTAPLKSWCRFRTKSEGRRNILKSQFLIKNSRKAQNSVALALRCKRHGGLKSPVNFS
jgi:hypothetical protein